MPTSSRRGQVRRNRQWCWCSAWSLATCGVHLVHVEALHRVDDLLERRARQRARLVEDQDALAEGHQGRDALDAQLPDSSWFASVSSFAKVMSECSSDAFS